MRIKLPPLWLVLLLVAAFWLGLSSPVSAVELTEPIPGASTAYDFGTPAEASEVKQDEPEESTQAEESSSPSLRSMGEDVATAEFQSQDDDSPKEEDSETFVPDLLDQITEISSNVQAIRENQELFYSEGASSDSSSSSSSDLNSAESGDSSISDESFRADGEISSSDVDSGNPDSSSDASTSTDPDLEELTLSDIHTDLWLILYSIWGIFGIFLAFKVGGAILGRL